MYSANLIIFISLSLIKLTLGSSLQNPFYGPPIPSFSPTCPSNPVCETWCPIININGCNRCQCPSYHPCVFFHNQLPLGCAECTSQYQENGCVSACNCTRTISESLSGITGLFTGRYKRTVPLKSQNQFDWSHAPGASACPVFNTCNVKAGCRFQFQWFKCPICFCPDTHPSSIKG